MAGFFALTKIEGQSAGQFKAELNRVYRWYTVGLLIFVGVLAGLEQMGLPRLWIGVAFLLATIGLYAGIGIECRTTDATEYYVAGRRVPAISNGMATGADWMSAASFIGLAGTLYLTGYSGLAFIMGWPGDTAWWRWYSHLICVNSVNSRFRIFSRNATAVPCRA